MAYLQEKKTYGVWKLNKPAPSFPRRPYTSKVAFKSESLATCYLKCMWAFGVSTNFNREHSLMEYSLNKFKKNHSIYCFSFILGHISARNLTQIHEICFSQFFQGLSSHMQQCLEDHKTISVCKTCCKWPAVVVQYC